MKKKTLPLLGGGVGLGLGGGVCLSGCRRGGSGSKKSLMPKNIYKVSQKLSALLCP